MITMRPPDVTPPRRTTSLTAAALLATSACRHWHFIAAGISLRYLTKVEPGAHVITAIRAGTPTNTTILGVAAEHR
jgi:hypothetical protein